MKTIEEIVMMIDDNKNYIKEVDSLYREDSINTKDHQLLKDIFEEFKDGHDKIAIHLLNYVGDTYIREKFTEIVLKLSK